MRLPILLALMIGCSDSPVIFNDSVDLELNFSRDSTKGLHTPYVAGADMGFWLRHRRDRKDISGWKAFSVDEDIFDIELVSADEDVLDFDAFALKEGEAEIVVLDENGEEVTTIIIEVGMPTEVVLRSHGALIVDRPDIEPDGTPQVLVGGTSTWLARYYRDGERLYGNGTLETFSRTASFDSWTEDSFLFEDRDWLQGSALSTGNHSVDLHVAGEYVETVGFKAIEEEAIDRVEIYGMDESRADDGDNLALLAQAFDSADEPIFGVEFGWEDDYGVESGLGDLYRYEYDSTDSNEVSATTQSGLGAVVEIHGEGYVDSTNDVGCSSSGAKPAAAFALFAAFGLLYRRQD